MGEPQPSSGKLTGREVIVGVSGGVAAYKTADLVSRLVQSGAGVTVVLTQAAEHFVGRATFEALTGRRVPEGIFDTAISPLGPHIALAEQADLLCIAPLTANLLARAAHGLADDLLSTLLLSFSGPVLVAPAMNSAMWEHPATQRNLATVRQDGVQIVDPGAGWLSCRQPGVGRMAEPETIQARVHELLSDGRSAR